MRKFVLVIGGSDSSGGSGIQADLRALQHFGCPASSAITAVTAQGPDGVVAIQLVEPTVLSAQIEQAFKGYEIGAVKIGMLGSEPQVRTVIEALRKYPTVTVVLDPVLASSSGTDLLDEPGRKLLIQELLPLATVVMPNVPELGRLTGMAVETDEQRVSAADRLIELGAGAVVVKGGHLDDPKDVLVMPGREPFSYGRATIKLPDARGTGCILASFVAALMARGVELPAAMKGAKGSLNHALLNAFATAEDAPGLLLTGCDATNLADREPPAISGIYFVSEGDLNPQITLSVGARLAMEGGARIVQLRDKRLSLPELIKTGKRMRDSARNRGAIFIVNDRVDLALALDADGVHLGPEDMPPEQAREILGWRKIIGLSVSTVEEARPIARFADYLAVGAIFGSSTKSDAGDAVGVERITQIKRAFPNEKIVAIGGINLSNIASVAAAGADAAAVVSAIVCAPDPVQATRDLLLEFERGKATFR